MFRQNYKKFEKRRTVINGPSRTHQSFKEESNINTIMKKFAKTGQLPEMINREPRYGDFIDAPDYLTAMNAVAHANEQFANLSAATRKRFSNDPAEFLEFATNPENGDEMIRLGLATRRQASDSDADAPEPTRKSKKAPQEPPGGPTSGSKNPAKGED